MTNDTDVLKRQIAKLEARIADEEDPELRQMDEEKLRALRAQLAGVPPPPAPPGVTQEVSGDGAVAINGNLENSPITTGDGNTVVQAQTIQQFFGTATPGEDKETLLAAYLDSLTSECENLRLGRLIKDQHSGSDQQRVPQLKLQAVYTSLTTNGTWKQVHHREYPAKRMKRLRNSIREYPPADVPPEQVRDIKIDFCNPPDDTFFASIGKRRDEQLTFDEQLIFDNVPPDTLLRMIITRPELATEAIRTHHRLVLLGEPGAGKSTVLRYLSLLLAMKVQGKPIDLAGWNDDYLPVPILCPLGTVAEVLKTEQPDPDKALWQAIGNVLDGKQSIRNGLRDYLKNAIRCGGVLLLFDGLDELPTSGNNPREQVAQAIRRFATTDGAKTPMVVTCRVVPYQQVLLNQQGDWKMPDDEGWQVRTVQPLEFGQVRQFVQQWYAELTQIDPDLSLEAAEAKTQKLLAALEEPRLHALTKQPLLLTMLAILHYNRDEIPNKRVKVYEECVQLLFDRWEPVRTPHFKRPGLLERLGNLPNLELDMLRNVLHRLAWKAHIKPPGDDGRGVLGVKELEGELLELFKKRYREYDPLEKVETFIQVLNEDAGLLQARSDEVYAFPHLTFQEYLAACGLVDRKDMISDAYEVWTGKDASRWQEVLRLMAGRLRLLGEIPAKQKGVLWLRHLLKTKVQGQEKPAIQRAKDASLAAQSYRELGEQEVLDDEEIDKQLKEGIVALLETRDSGVVVEERVDAAFLLGELGDPRPGVCTLPPAMVRIEGGTFVIGNPKGEEKYEDEINRKPVTVATFEIGRYPITNAQYKLFIDDGGYDEEKEWWDNAGRAWLGKEKVKEPRIWNKEPRIWNNERFSKTKPNHPVIWITWYEAMAYCRWLTQKMNDRYIYRLPTEAEWEYAVRRNTGRTYPWGNEEPDGERANYGSNHNGTTAVGVFPKGATTDGIYDMAGNVREWTGSIYKPYPYDPNDGREDLSNPASSTFVLRGGGWYVLSDDLRASPRYGLTPDYLDIGFRLARHLP